jgi:phage terminase large subunit-like protein
MATTMGRAGRTRSRRSTSSSSAGRVEALDELRLFEQFCSTLTLEDGRPLQLEAFQREMLSDLFAGCTETLILLPKKNGKTTLTAALALYHLVTTPDAECVIAAASRDQASILYRQAGGFVRKSEWLLERVVVKKGTKEIRSRVDEGRIRVLASDADTADGVIPTLAIVDELHRHKTPDLYGVFRDGLGPREGRMVTISTAGEDEESPLGLMRQAALGLPGLSRVGAKTTARSADGSYAMHEWALDPEDDREDMSVVKRANPASWQTEELLARRRRSPSMRPWQWARFGCGVWVRGESSAIDPAAWARCGCRGVEIPRGAPVVVGLDTARVHDSTAIVPVWRVDPERVRTAGAVILEAPGDGRQMRVGAITPTILEMAARWEVIVAVDPNAAGGLVAEELDDLGLTVVEHSQDPAPMAASSMLLATLVAEGHLEHDEHPTVTSQVLAAIAKTAGGEKWRLARPERGRHRTDRGPTSARVRIDAGTALAMACWVAFNPPERGESVYEHKELLILE